MSSTVAVAAALSGVIGALLLYLASPQQQLLPGQPWPRRRPWVPGAVCVALSLLLMLQVLGHGAAVFAWLTLLMLVWSLAPFVGAWVARRRTAR